MPSPLASRSVFALLATLLGGCAHSAPAPTSGASTPGASLGGTAWERLKHTLPGTWNMRTTTGPFVVSYKLISAESALVEEWGPGTPHETETVFYPDHADLLLTHYCAQGNQPRLRVAEVSSDSIIFRFVDVTNGGPDKPMLVERTLRFATDGFDDTEVYRSPDGTNDITTYHFTRAATP